MSNDFRLKNAEYVRRSITLKNQRYIRRFYEGLSGEISRGLKNKKEGYVGSKDRNKLRKIQKDLKNEIKRLDKSIRTEIESGMEETSRAVVKDARSFLGVMGFKEYDAKNAFSGVPHEVVRNVLTGNVYVGQNVGQPLSKNIWNVTRKNVKDIDNIIARGIALNKDIYEIAKDLEKYVNPSVKKNIYLGVDKVVDYNAQRLARTMVSQAYWQSFKNVCDGNPFVVAYRWITADIHGRTCEVCRHRAYDDHHGLGPGVYPKDELPVDHPNGMCDFEAVVPYSKDFMSQQVSDWYEEPLGTYPDLDEYADQLGKLERYRR